MTPRERVLAVYAGEKPDQVPLLLDLSHWHKANRKLPFDLTGYKGVDHDLVALHKKVQAVSYVEMGGYFDLYTDNPKITDTAWTDSHGVFHRKITTPAGVLEEERIFSEQSYSYNIRKHLLQSVEDFEAVKCIMKSYKVKPRWDRYTAWREALGDLGVIYCPLPYSGLGYLISRNFGIENTVYAAMDYPKETQELIDAVNTCNLSILDTIIDGPFEILIISDNFDSNVQNEGLFNQYSRAYYTEVARRLHAAGKYLAVHVDGEMRGCLKNFKSCGVDCIDAATPSPMFSLTPKAAREEAGHDLILSGGIPANIFGSGGSDADFVTCVLNWLDTRTASFRLFMAAGDQVPTDAPFHRIEMLHELTAQYGRF